jgi:hypothetical protein
LVEGLLLSLCCSVLVSPLSIHSYGHHDGLLLSPYDCLSRIDLSLRNRIDRCATSASYHYLFMYRLGVQDTLSNSELRLCIRTHVWSAASALPRFLSRWILRYMRSSLVATCLQPKRQPGRTGLLEQDASNPLFSHRLSHYLPKTSYAIGYPRIQPPSTRPTGEQVDQAIISCRSMRTSTYERRISTHQ